MLRLLVSIFISTREMSFYSYTTPSCAKSHTSSSNNNKCNNNNLCERLVECICLHSNIDVIDISQREFTIVNPKSRCNTTSFTDYESNPNSVYFSNLQLTYLLRTRDWLRSTYIFHTKYIPIHRISYMQYYFHRLYPYV